MSASPVILYTASAGSGKTFQLTRNYLEMLFRAEENYASILAVTFTNKAAGELKERVLRELVSIASGQSGESQHLAYLSELFGRDESMLIRRAAKILRSVLNDYSRFSIGTIDEFFQQILRSFARDLGVYSGYVVELQTKRVIEEAVSRLIRSCEKDPELFAWVEEGIGEKIEEGENWKKFERSLVDLGEQLLTEKLSMVLLVPGEEFFSREQIRSFKQTLKDIMAGFESRMKEIGLAAREILRESGLQSDDFIQKSKGPVAAMIRLADGDYDLKPKTKFREDPEEWMSKSTRRSVRSQGIELVRQHLLPLFEQAADLYETTFPFYQLAERISKDLMRLGLLSALAAEISSYSGEQGIFLISFTNSVIARLVHDNPAPFIYERTGRYYQYYLIDEFQDTSSLQWMNFLPLIKEAVASGGKAVLVGDAKQSIYRWRNSNWQLIAREAEADLHPFSVSKLSLEKNYRSRMQIIDFNNQFFGKGGSVVMNELQTQLGETELVVSRLFDATVRLYQDMIQKPGFSRQGGFVTVQRVEGAAADASDEADDGEQHAGFPAYYTRILQLVKDLQQVHHYTPDQIVFLVRKKDQGARLIRYFASIRQQEADSQPYSLELISADSLTLRSSPVIRSIISLLRLSTDPNSHTFLSEFVLNRLLARDGAVRPEEAAVIASRNRDKLLQLAGVPNLDEWLPGLNDLTAGEAVEQLIRRLELMKQSGALPFLFDFKDGLANWLKRTGAAGHEAVLIWWDEEGSNRVLAMSNQINAMRVMTIHKAKGLEFPVVILPDANWAFDHSSTHAPYLWVSTQNTPFDEVPLVPVKYIKSLLSGPYAKDYQQEKIQTYLDHINLLYVAFTRACDRLHVFYTTSKSSAFRVSHLLDAVVMKEADQSEYTFGDPDTCAGKHTKDRYEVRFPEEILFGMPVAARPMVSFESDSMQRGAWLHALLEAVHHAEDLHEQMDKLVQQADLSQEQASEIAASIRRIIAHPDLQPYYSDQAEVFNEKAIFMPRSGRIRPDRVARLDKRVGVIEYKTGHPYPAHTHQLKTYQEGLQKMGYETVEAFLVYLDSAQVVRV